MLAFILLSSGILAFAVSYELIAMQYQPAALVAAFWSLPVSQRGAWLVIGLAPICLILLALVQHCMLVAKRCDPETALDALRARVATTEQTIEFHQQRNQSGDLIGCVEEVRQQQQEVRLKLGDAIAKRRSIETSISQLQSSQEEMEQGVAVIEQNSEGETLERRLQKLAQFIGTANSRCEEIEHAMPSLLQLEEKFEALQRRLWPLEQRESGVNSVLQTLYDTGNRVAAGLARLEQDEGVSLGDRIRELAKTKHGLEERVSSVLAQFSEIETLHKDINGLFLRLNQAHRIPRELDAAGRVVPFNG